VFAREGASRAEGNVTIVKRVITPGRVVFGPAFRPTPFAHPADALRIGILARTFSGSTIVTSERTFCLPIYLQGRGCMTSPLSARTCWGGSWSLASRAPCLARTSEVQCPIALATTSAVVGSLHVRTTVTFKFSDSRQKYCQPVVKMISPGIGFKSKGCKQPYRIQRVQKP
jgi:hypothetical protein